MTRAQKSAGLVVLGVVTAVALWLWLGHDGRARSPRPGGDSAVRGRPLEYQPVASLDYESPMGALPRPLDGTPCTVDQILASLRGSPSHEYRIYLHHLFGRTASTLGDDELERLFRDERDPTALLILGVHVAERFNKNQTRALLDALMQRAQHDPDPALRAQAVASLAHLGNTGAQALGELGVATYDQLILDPASEVRDQVAQNLWEEHTTSVPRMRETGRVALRAARATDDPRLATRLIEKLTLDTAGAEERADLGWLVREGQTPELRTAAARVMGSLPAAERDSATEMLVSEYGRQSAPVIRAAILAALVRLHFAGAVPILESLRPLDTRMSGEIDKWLTVLAQGRQEWHLLMRHKKWLDEQG